MGSFEKLSVVVIGVIIVMILVVAVYTWTSDPAPEAAVASSIPDVGPGPATDTPQDNARLWAPWEPEKEKSAAPKPPVGGESTPKPQDSPPSVDAEKPVEEKAAEQTYVVQSGDTLGGISQRFYRTTKHWPKIAERNGVSPDGLRVGATLFIPILDGAAPVKPSEAAPAAAGRPVKGQTYKVRRGDTIQSIAKHAFGSIERWPDIWFENMERVGNPNDLPVGLELKIPD